MGSIEAIIDRQLRRWELEKKQRAEEIKNGQESQVLPIVTVSRQRGSGGTIIAEKLAAQLGYQLLHREVIDEICKSSGYRRQVIESLDDRVRSRIELWFEGVLKGPLVDASDYLRHLCRVIKTIAEHGGVVVVGRGANFILKGEQMFSLRVVAPVSTRVENLIQREKMAREQAEHEIEAADRSRTDFIHVHFKKNIDDPQAYDLVLNTAFIDVESAEKIALEGVRSKWRKLGRT